MKKLIIIIALAGFTTAAIAQESGDRRPIRPSSTEIIKTATRELSLTDYQVKQWNEIHKKYEAIMKDKEDFRQKLGEELEATLTTEQLEKFKNMRKDHGRPPKRN